jgi:hypothetical protein
MSFLENDQFSSAIVRAALRQRSTEARLVAAELRATARALCSIAGHSEAARLELLRADCDHHQPDVVPAPRSFRDV